MVSALNRYYYVLPHRALITSAYIPLGIDRIRVITFSSANLFYSSVRAILTSATVWEAGFLSLTLRFCWSQRCSSHIIKTSMLSIKLYYVLFNSIPQHVSPHSITRQSQLQFQISVQAKRLRLHAVLPWSFTSELIEPCITNRTEMISGLEHGFLCLLILH